MKTSPAGGESDPDAPEPAVVLGPIKKWPGNQAARGEIAAMAPPMLKPGRFRAPDKLLAMLNTAGRKPNYAE